MQKDKVISRRKVIVRTESNDENKYIYLFFFCNQQFITQGTVAVYAYKRLFMVYQS